MSMIGEYLRVTPTQLDRARQDPQWALELAEQIQDAQEEDQPTPGQGRHYSTYQTWDLLGFLLRRAGFPVDIVHGEEPFAQEDDWGYGPPTFLTAHRVQAAADALTDMRYDDLIADVDYRELVKAKVYPQGWDSPNSFEWARDWFENLKTFFHTSASQGDAMLIWID